MEVFEDLAKYSTEILIGGIITFVLGFLMKRSAKKDTALSVIATIFLTIGTFLLFLSILRWIAECLKTWGFISDRMI